MTFYTQVIWKRQLVTDFACNGVVVRLLPVIRKVFNLLKEQFSSSTSALP